MSTTTNFKRSALVAVAALGMGLLSSTPSQAAFTGAAGSQLTVTSAAGTGSLTGAASDSTTAATVSVTGLALAASDSYTIVTAKKSWPALMTGTSTPQLLLMLKDTATSTGKTVATATTAAGTAFTTTTDSATTVIVGDAGAGTNVYVASSFYAFQD